MIGYVNISMGFSPGSSDERGMGGPMGKVSAAQSPGGASSNTTLRDQKLGCSPTVRPLCGGSKGSWRAGGDGG